MRPPSSLEDDLDEVDFYVSQDMLVEAADLLRGLLAKHPAHPLLTTKLRDIEALAGGGDFGGDVGEDAIEDERAADDDEIEELADDDVEELSDSQVFEVDDGAQAVKPVKPATDAGQAAAKKKKPAVVLERPIDDSDAETHYDLGLAYKEMGLYDEAIKAFEKITGNLQRQVQCRLMIGLCRREQGNYSEAIHAFKAGLHAPQVTDREKQSLFYEIGISYEAMGDVREALYYFEMVTKRDPTFLDVTARVARLKNGRGAGDDDDGDRGGGGGGDDDDDGDPDLDALLDEA